MDWSRGGAVDRSVGKLGGAWCFRGTRVPAAALDEFVDWFPPVSRERAHAVLEFAKGSLGAPAAVA